MVGQKGIDLKIGQKIHYKSNSMIHPYATYDGEVVGVYKYFYEILGKPIKSSLHVSDESVFGEPRPYKFCISKYLDVDQERVTIVEDTTLGDVIERIA
jgi:hypothetical protein